MEKKDASCVLCRTAPNICFVYGNDAIPRRISPKWLVKLQNGIQDLKDALRPGESPGINDNYLKVPLKNDSRQTTRELAEKMNSVTQLKSL